MKINVVLVGNGDDISMQMFDAWYAYKQSQSSANDMSIDVEFNISENIVPGHTNILMTTMSTSVPSNIDDFDLIFFTNVLESCSISTDTVVNNMFRENAYFINGSTVLPTHNWASKFYNPQLNVVILKDFLTRQFYPQYYNAFQDRTKDRTCTMTFINGANRAHRYYFHRLLDEGCPEVHQRSSLGTMVHETDDAYFESDDDSKFRIWVNEYAVDKIVRNIDTDYLYYENSIPVGINSKFGKVALGMFLLPEYWNSHCVIFPESSWVNNSLHITEKSVKCFFAECFPWPVAGSNINKIYNTLGFYTAWNLLPSELQKFDSITDHCTRYQMQITAIKWLYNNTSVFNTKEAKDMLRSNYLNFHSYKPIIGAMQQLDNILEKHERRH